MTPKERARKSADAMWSDDRASGWFGMELLEVDEGTAMMALTVQSHHVNGNNICRGGVTFSLADSAFAVACNSRNQASIAQQNTISYIAPARLGDRLTATACEVRLSGRSSGITDVRVVNHDRQTIAEFRGASRAINGQLFSEEDTDT